MSKNLNDNYMQINSKYIIKNYGEDYETQNLYNAGGDPSGL